MPLFQGEKRVNTSITTKATTKYKLGNRIAAMSIIKVLKLKQLQNFLSDLAKIGVHQMKVKTRVLKIIYNFTKIEQFGGIFKKRFLLELQNLFQTFISYFRKLCRDIRLTFFAPLLACLCCEQTSVSRRTNFLLLQMGMVGLNF